MMTQVETIAQSRALTVHTRHGAARRPREARVLIVSNRLPFTATTVNGEMRVLRSSGGLATGLRGVHERSNGLWIGWTGASADAASGAGTVEAQLRDAATVPVHLTASQVEGFYRRYANEVLWPLLHDHAVSSSPGDWETYRAVNALYAESVARHARPGDLVWVHDYHLMLVPRLLRERRPDLRVGFFLHTPFPEPNAFATLPESAALLDGLLGADVVGFHTKEYLHRFDAAVRSQLRADVHHDEIHYRGCTTNAVAYAMGVDTPAFEERASAPSVKALTERIRGEHPGAILLGIDRMDYTKGIPERLLAFERLLQGRVDLHERVTLLQLAVPSREDVPAYGRVRRDVEAVVARINRRFGTARWTPIRYTYGSVDPETLVALYRAADVMLVTSLCDGMNLVAKEFVASRVDGDGVLLLSDRTGAAAELRASLLVDPRDVDSLARAYASALEMSRVERRVRMRRLRLAVSSQTVHRWATQCLDALRDAAPASLPLSRKIR